MMGNFLTRAMVLAFGYAYPAYECYKTVELNKPEIEQLIFWCQYWILVAVLTVLERFGDVFISWLPMYSEAKLAFFVYLWYPKTKGTTYIYQTFFQPYIAQHENEIDRNILELRARVGDLVVLYWQKVANYSQTTFFDVLQFVASQSPSNFSRSKPVQPQKPPQQIRRTASISAARQPAASKKLQEPTAAPSSPKIQRQDSKRRGPTTPSVQLQELKEAETEAVPPSAPVAQPPESAGLVDSSSSEDTTTIPIADAEGEAVPVEVANATGKEDLNPPQEVTPIEEAIRVTRNKLRKRVATVAP